MTGLASNGFFVVAAALILAAYLASPGIAYRRWVLLIGNIGILAMLFPSATAALPLAAFLLLGYGAAVFVTTRSSIRGAGAAVFALVASFVYLKQYQLIAFLPPLPFAYSVIGLSYILFRVLHVVLDRHQGAIAAPPSAVDFVNYTCFFPAFICGPIQRFEDFAHCGYGAASPLTAPLVRAALARIVTGLFKVVLSQGFNGLFKETADLYLTPALSAGGSVPLDAAYAAAAAFYTLYLYLNFAGWIDVAIALGRLFGIVLPENFDRPFASRNFIEFWSRWHMTLSAWFKTYLFNPLLKTLLARWRSPALAPYLAVPAYFVTFLAIGLWHGTTLAFVYYGLVLGAGVSGNKLYQVLLARWLGRRRALALGRNPLYQALCRGATFAYFAMALTAFWSDAQRLYALFLTLQASGLAIAFVGLVIAAATMGSAVSFLARLWRGAGRSFVAWASDIAPGAAWGNAGLAAQILVLIGLASLFNSGPDFVYQGF